MKKVAILAVTSLGIFNCNAQKINAAKVPIAVKNSFEKNYPGVSAKWEKENPNYEVNFKKENNDMSVIIDTKGNILETETDVKITDLPGIALSYIKEHYKGSNVKEAAKITKADGTVTYEAEVAGKDIIFDAVGKFIKESKD